MDTYIVTLENDGNISIEAPIGVTTIYSSLQAQEAFKQLDDSKPTKIVINSIRTPASLGSTPNPQLQQLSEFIKQNQTMTSIRFQGSFLWAELIPICTSLNGNNRLTTIAFDENIANSTSYGYDPSPSANTGYYIRNRGTQGHYTLCLFVKGEGENEDKWIYVEDRNRGLAPPSSSLPDQNNAHLPAALQWVNALTMLFVVVDMILAGYLEIEANDSDSYSAAEIPRVIFSTVGFLTFYCGCLTLADQNATPPSPISKLSSPLIPMQIARSVIILGALSLLASAVWAFVDYDTISETASPLEKDLFISNYSVLGFCAAWQAVNQSVTLSKEWKSPSITP